MKRLITVVITLALVALAVVLGGKRALEYTLDAQLAPLLTREIGVPVSLGPISTQLRTLTAHSTRLAMGERQRPAVVAEDVTVSLDWQSLMRAEVKLVYARASKLTVQPSRWPGNDDPWPTDYTFLDPILPSRLELVSGQYIDSDGDSLPVQALQWQRDGAGATLTWQQQFNQVTVDLKSELTSLNELLQLARLRLQTTVQRPGDNTTAISAMLDLHPDDGSGYAIDAQVHADGMEAKIETGNPSAWEFPAKSSTRVNLLDLVKVRQLTKAYSRARTDGDKAADPLDTALPTLALPAHRGTVHIDTIRWRDEAATEGQVQFDTGDEGVQLTSIAATGPAGRLSGSAGVGNVAGGWQVSLLADITATDRSLAPAYMGSDWLWHTGRADMRGVGKTTGELLNSLQGSIDLAGTHRGETDTPVTISAELDNSPDKLSLRKLDIRVADGRISGDVSLSGTVHHTLSARVRAEKLDLDFLIAPRIENSEPGSPLPTFVEAFPALDLDWDVSIDGFEAGGVNLAAIEAKLTRTPKGGELRAQAVGNHRGKLGLSVTSATLPGKNSDFSMKLDMDDIDLEQLFDQTRGLIPVRTSGSIVFAASGNNLREVLAGAQGKADLTGHIDWGESKRDSSEPQDQFTLRGEARLVLKKDRIVGLEISQLALQASRQNLGGSLSVEAGRNPWLIADLTSNKLDIDALHDLQSDQAADDSGESGSLQALRDAGHIRISLHARAVKFRNQTLPSAVVAYSSTRDEVSLDKLDIDTGPGHLQGSGQLSWQGQTAHVSLDLAIEDVDLERFLNSDTVRAPTPVSGSVNLHSSGDTTAGLIANLVGDIKLRDSGQAGGASVTPAREVDMTARRTAEGMEARVKRLNWGETSVSGDLRYIDTEPPSVDITLAGGALSLAPWEPVSDKAAVDKKKRRDPLSTVTETARAGADFVGELIMSPFNWARDSEGAAPGERMFSDKPLPFESITDYRVTVRGTLDKLVSRQATVEDVKIDASLRDGSLKATLSAGQYNQGSAEIALTLEAREVPAAIALNGTFKDVHSDEKPESFTRTGHFNLTSTGQSTAEIAANLDGIVYLELGPGLIDYSEMVLITADVATEMFRALIPGLDKKVPRLDCAVTLGVFEKGLGVTPYGYAVRTREANLVGRAKIELGKEIIELDVSSSNRRGVGISVSSVFSNTVEIKGPLTNPELVPDTTGLLWRGWAAVMTGGLSVIGESMFKRVLASENPCDTVKEKIHEDFCPKNQAAAASAMICPTAQG